MAVAISAYASPVGAETVQVGFTAVVTGFSDPAQYLPDALIMTDTLTGYYVYENVAVDEDPDPHRGYYQFISMPTTMIVYADSGWVFRTDETNVLVRFTIGDSLYWVDSPADAYNFRSVNNESYVGGQPGLPMGLMQIELLDRSLSALPDDGLSVQPPDLNAWPDQRQLIIAGSSLDWVIFADVVTTSSTLPTPVSDAPPRMRGWLGQNVPNPFNPSTAIPFTIGQPAHVTLVVYDVAGRPVRRLVNERLPAGDHETPWDGRDMNGRPVASGVYFYRLVAGSFTDTKKMTILK